MCYSLWLYRRVELHNSHSCILEPIWLVVDLRRVVVEYIMAYHNGKD